MDIKKIKKIINLVTESNLKELEIKSNNEFIRIISGRQCAPEIVSSHSFCSPMIALPTENGLPPPSSPEINTKAGHNIESPIVGTIYLSSSPNTKNFVEIGQKINVGDTLCLIEAMKTFNKIEILRA